MIEQVLNFLHNYFEEEILQGDFSISSETIVIPSAKDGQYIKIVGSSLNDGIYEYPPTNLNNEDFTGEVWLLAIPASVRSLIKRIGDWELTNNSQSPFTSESFGGYSYTKGSNAKTGNPLGWQDVFRSELNTWRKLI